LTTILYLAAHTEKLAFGETMFISFYPPFMLARKLLSLDHVSDRRIGWNIVCSMAASEARNFGLDALREHDVRYDRADIHGKFACRLGGRALESIHGAPVVESGTHDVPTVVPI